MPQTTETRQLDAPVVASSRRLPLIWLAPALGVLWFICCRHLSSEWRFNEQYGYGWFVPFFALYLFWLRWEDRPAEIQISDFRFQIVAVLTICLSALILLPLRVFEIANPDWRPLGWIHAIVAVSITLAMIHLIGGGRWLRHFAFPVCFLLTAVPWPTPIETPIVQGLMRGIAAATAETIALFGIPAQVQGNLIRLSNGVVGINEACSGVRSLQTSLMIGLLFGEIKRLSLARRVVLVATAIAIALIANSGRSLFLVSVAAREGITAVSKWHDLAGYAIVALVFAGTMWTAANLSKADGGRRRREERARSLEPGAGIRKVTLRSPLTASCILLLIWFLVIEAGAETWYRIHEHDSVGQARWTIHWPENEPDFRDLKIDDGIRETLRYDIGKEASCKIPLNNETQSRILLFYFRWNPGGTSTVLRARAHRPDICLPAAGWKQIADKGYENFSISPGFTLPVRRVTFAQPHTGTIAHTYFCLQEDVANPSDPRPDLETRSGAQPDWGAAGRWGVARNGIRNRGQQVLEVIMIAPADVSDATVDGRFAKLLTEIVVPR